MSLETKKMEWREGLAQNKDQKYLGSAKWYEKTGGPASKWAGGKGWEKPKLNSGMQKYFLERYRQMQGEKEGATDTQM